MKQIDYNTVAITLSAIAHTVRILNPDATDEIIDAITNAIFSDYCEAEGLIPDYVNAYNNEEDEEEDEEENDGYEDEDEDVWFLLNQWWAR